MHVYPLTPSLPWDIFPDEQERLRKVLLVVIVATLVLSVVFTFLPVFEEDQEQTIIVPKHVVKMVLEQKKETPPPPKPLPVPEIKEEPKVIEPPKPKPPEPKPEVKQPPKPKPVAKEPPKPAPKPKPSAKQQAQSAFKNVFGSSLDDLQDNKVVASLDSKAVTNAGNVAGTTERSMITSNAGRASGGINDANLSRGTGGSGSLSGSAGTSKGSSRISKKAGGSGTATSRRTGSGRKAKRSEEEIQIVSDRNRGSFDRLYARALRNDPSLQGKVVFRLTISPAGSVTSASIVSSELGSPDLERKLALKVKQLKFKSGDKAVTTINYPIDFFPS